jgi:hypothetical protein
MRKPYPQTVGYRFGDIVYLRIREERVAGMVTAIHLYPTGKTYGVSWADDGQESVHYALELDTEFAPLSSNGC